MTHPSPNPPSSAHIVLVGFASSGKSTVGRLLAERIGRTFVDVDDVIAKETGQFLAEFVRRAGPVALRARERALFRRLLASPAPLVIATGGDTFLDPLLREWIADGGQAVYLEADPETLARRFSCGNRAAQRPIRPGPSLVETIARLLAAARPTYEEAALKVRNDGERIEDVVQLVAQKLRLDRTEGRRWLKRAV